jgi:hypothetical protein
MAEYMIKQWNELIVPSVTGAHPVDTFSDLHMRDGSPLPTTYYMDVIYPSKPIVPVPLMIRFTTDLVKDSNRGDLRYHFAGFTLRGGAYAAVEHCYDPLYMDYWKELGSTNYTFVNYLGLAMGQTAVRQLTANASRYGIDPQCFFGHGLSKGQLFVTRMLNPHHEQQTELARLEGFPSGRPEPLPYFGVPARLKAGYQSAGAGNFYYNKKDADGNLILSPDYLPTMIAMGAEDQSHIVTAYHQFVAKLDELGVTNYLSLLMPGVAHENPQGWNPDLQRDNYEMYIEFFKQHGGP